MMNLREGIQCEIACITLLTKANGQFLTLIVGNVSQHSVRAIVK